MEAKIKRMYIEAKKSHNFQSYTVGLDIDLDLTYEHETTLEIIREIQAKCRKLAIEQINIDKGVK